MVFYQIMFVVCLLLLFGAHAALAAARKKGDRSQARVLHFFRLGLSLSAISYLLRLLSAPPFASPPLLIVATCLAGTVFIWLGWSEHWKLWAKRRNTRFVSPEEEDAPGAETPLAAFPALDLSRFTARAQRALIQAQFEAARQQECCVETDHLLLGLLHDSGSASARLLDVLGAAPEKVHRELRGQALNMGNTGGRTQARPERLTDRAAQVLTLAAQEAHRFGQTSVGTEHLLLGLVLVGKGRATAVLFQEGVTVDGIRSQLLKTKKPPDLVRL